MEFENTESRYGTIAIFIHWLMAILIIALIILGLYMVRLPDVGYNYKKIILILLHKELGALALVLVVFRVFWRIMNVTPKLAATIPELQKMAAHAAHAGLYFFMFALPISGWLMTSAAGIPVTFFGLFEIPNWGAVNEYKMYFYINAHTWLAYGLILLIIAHASAALLHHFYDKDDTLKKMLP